MAIRMLLLLRKRRRGPIRPNQSSAMRFVSPVDLPGAEDERRLRRGGL
jgi:hypothetical protein